MVQCLALVDNVPGLFNGFLFFDQDEPRTGLRDIELGRGFFSAFFQTENGPLFIDWCVVGSSQFAYAHGAQRSRMAGISGPGHCPVSLSGEYSKLRLANLFSAQGGKKWCP